jgi:hypothetical protein
MAMPLAVIQVVVGFVVFLVGVVRKRPLPNPSPGRSFFAGKGAIRPPSPVSLRTSGGGG